jgi:ribosomal-protein-alanine N-acetyltransferase
MGVKISRWRETPFSPDALHAICDRAFSKAGIRKPPGWRPADWSVLEKRPLPSQEVLVAHARERILGVAVTAVTDGVCDLMLIAVDPDLSRAGLGAALIETAGKLALPRGAHRMMLEVSAENSGACAFYRSIGFEQTGRRKGYFGPGHDALVMSQFIREAVT